MPTLPERLKKDRLVAGAAFRLGGVPYLFGSFADPSWTLDGDTYTWLKVLSRDAIELAAEEADPWTGRAIVGNGGCRLVIDPTVGALLQTSLSAAIKTVLTADASPADTTINVQSTAAFPSSAVIRIGLETLSYTGKTATSFTGCSRGLWGSRAQRHLASLDTVTEIGAGGPIVSSQPLSWVGRTVDLYVCPMRRLDGVDTPIGSSLDDAENWHAERGIITAIEPSWGAGQVAISWQSLASLLEREVATRLPRATVGLPSGFYQLDVDSNRFQWAISRHDSPRSSHDSEILDPATGEPLAVGLYSVSAIAAALAYTVAAAGLPLTADVTGHGIERDGKIELSLILVGDGAVYNYQIETWIGRNSILPELGFLEVPAPAIIDDDDGADYWRASTWTADESPPAWRLTAAGLRRLYLRPKIGPSFTASPGWLDDAGDGVNGHALVGEEIVEFDRAAAFTLGPLEVPYLQISRRGRFGSLASEIVVARDDDPEEVRQVIAMPSTSWPRAFRYLAESDGGASGFDHGWRGAGAALAADDFDAASFELAAIDPRSARDIVVTDVERLIDVMGPCLVQAGYFVRSSTTIELVRAQAPRARDSIEPAAELVQGDLDSTQPPEWRQPEDQIVNVFAIEDYQRNEATGEGSAFELVQGTSIGTWGRKDTVALSMRHCSRLEADAIMREAAVDIFSRFGSPFALLKVELRRRRHAFALRVGDVVTISHGCLPSGSGGRGLVDRLAVVWRIARKLRGQGAPAEATLVAYHLRGETRGLWCPSASCTSRTGPACTVAEHAYSDPLEEADAAAFGEGWPVRLYDTDDESTAEEGEIYSIVGNVITLRDTPTLTAPFTIELGEVNEDLAGFAYFDEGVELG